MKHIITGLLLTLMSTVGWGNLLPVDNGKVDVKVYSPPELIEHSKPRYPRQALSRGIEGWVTMQLMVDTKGNTYDIEVVDSNGNRSLELAAVRAAKKFKYKPAEFQGEPIDASALYRTTFVRRDHKFLSKTFTTLFNQFQTAVKESRQSDMELLISKLDEFEITTLYESTLAQLMKGVYATSIDDLEGTRRAYGAVLGLNADFNFFTEEQARSFRLISLQAQVATGHGRAALNTWSKLEPVLSDEQLRRKLTSQMTKVQSVLEGNASISVSGLIPACASFAYQLAKPSFALSRVVGELEEVKLYCEKGRVAFPVAEDVIYTVKKELGNCNLVVFGAPEATFEIIDGA